MAITPKEALGLKREKEQVAIQGFESRCDDFLKDNFDGRSTNTLYFEGVSEFVRDEVMKRFQATGWTVKHADSQREGQSLTFSEYFEPDLDRP